MLDEGDVSADPMTQFGQWLSEATAAGVAEPTAMALATATPEGRPSLRVVLLKGHDESGFVFFTNLDSRKGREIADNPRVALDLCWVQLQRQVVVSGAAEELPRAVAEDYFASRPFGSRLAAWASPQSEVIFSRAVLEQRFADAAERFGAGPVPMPPRWGGFRVRPETVEFWAGRPDRLHDRLRYRRTPEGWAIERLAP